MSTDSILAAETTDTNNLIPSNSQGIQMTSAEYTSRVIGSYLLLFGLVFGIAASVNKRTMLPQMSNKGAWITAIFIQFVLLPVMGYMIVEALHLDFASGITLLLITTSPGGVYSNWFCTIFNGDVALSVSLTSISTALSIIMIPCNLVLYGTNAYNEDSVDTIHWGSVFLSIFVVLTAAITGLYFSAKLDSTPFNVLAHAMGQISGGFLVLFLILVIIYADETKINLFGQSWPFYVGVASPCVLALVLSMVFCAWFDLPKSERVSVTLECFYQNISIAAALAIAMFEGDMLSNVLAVPLYYGIVQFVIMNLYCITVWKLGWTKAPKDEKFWKIIFRPYEILNLENKEAKNRQTTTSSNISGGNGVRYISDAHVVNVVDEFVDNAFVDVELGPSLTTNLPKDEVYVDEVYVDEENINQPKRFSFRNKAKVMDAKAPMITPSSSTLGPAAFAHTTKKGGSFKRKKKAGRKSNAVLKQLIIEETINEDSLAEDPDISIAGESDLESGLSVSVYGDEVSLSGFSNIHNRPSSRATDRIITKDSISCSNSRKEGQGNHDEPDTESTPTKSNVIIQTDATELKQNIQDLPFTVDVTNDTSTEQFDEISLHENDLSSDAKDSKPVGSSPLEVSRNNEVDSSGKQAEVTENQELIMDLTSSQEKEQSIDLVVEDNQDKKPSDEENVQNKTTEVVDETQLEDKLFSSNDQPSIMQESSEEEDDGSAFLLKKQTVKST